MGHRESYKAKADEAVRSHLKRRSGRLATAREIALEMGWPWQQVAWTLRRLVAKKMVVCEESERKDHRYRTRRVVSYRVPVGPALSVWPAWMMGAEVFRPVKKTLRKPGLG